MELKTPYIKILGHTSIQQQISAFQGFQIQNGDLKTIFHCSSSTIHRAAETAVSIYSGKNNVLFKL